MLLLHYHHLARLIHEERIQAALIARPEWLWDLLRPSTKRLAW